MRADGTAVSALAFPEPFDGLQEYVTRSKDYLAPAGVHLCGAVTKVEWHTWRDMEIGRVLLAEVRQFMRNIAAVETEEAGSLHVAWEVQIRPDKHVM